MGTYINPGNDGFARILERRYVDKTGIIALTNDVAGSAESLVCVTRPRRFGKSFAAQAVAAYYCYGCDSHALFDGLAISRDPSYEKHLNAYNVVSFDASKFVLAHGADVVEPIIEALQEDLCQEFGFERAVDGFDGIEKAFLEATELSGRRFFFVIDEWDAPMREDAPDRLKKRYVDFLRLFFKNGNFTYRAVEGAYMTGYAPQPSS